MKNTRDTLLLTACAVFAEKGFQEANVADICKKAQTNIAAINYYFGGKEKLYLQAMECALELAEAAYPLYSPASGPESPREQLSRFIRTQFLRASCETPAGYLNHFMVHEMTNPSCAHTVFMHKCIRRMRDHLNTLLRAILPPNIPEAYVWVCHYNIVSLFTFPLIMRTLHHGKHKNMCPPPPPPEDMALSATLFAFGGMDAIIRMAEEGKAPPAITPPPQFLECWKGERE